MVELLPCPFCNRQLEHYAAIEATRHPKIPYEEYCPLVGFLFASDRTDIINAWNTRSGVAQGALPTKLTGEMACILEDCSGPEKQTPEAVKALIEMYQPMWDKLIEAVTSTDGGAS